MSKKPWPGPVPELNRLESSPYPDIPGRDKLALSGRKMGRRRWRAGEGERAGEMSFLQRFRKPIAIAAAFAAAIAFFVYRFNTSRNQYGDVRTDYNRAISDCMQDRTRVANGSGAVDDAADSCVRDTPSPEGDRSR